MSLIRHSGADSLPNHPMRMRSMQVREGSVHRGTIISNIINLLEHLSFDLLLFQDGMFLMRNAIRFRDPTSHRQWPLLPLFLFLFPLVEPSPSLLSSSSLPALFFFCHSCSFPSFPLTVLPSIAHSPLACRPSIPSTRCSRASPRTPVPPPPRCWTRSMSRPRSQLLDGTVTDEDL